MGRMADVLAEVEQLNREGNLRIISHTVSIDELCDFTYKEIRDIRIHAHMTQGVFAKVLGVSIKTIEAWEGDRSKPVGPAKRLLALMKINPRFADDVGIIKR